MSGARRRARGLGGALLLGLVVVAGCRCEEWIPITDHPGSFQARPTAIDFGPVLEGTRVSATVTLTSTGRFSQTVVMYTRAPFHAPGSVELPAGGQVSFKVSFDATDQREEEQLVLLAGASSEAVLLRGTGVRPLECIPTAPCRSSTFDVQSNRCVESIAADGQPCESENLCLENTVCQAGSCTGALRACDDGNACTLDGACSPSLGCIHRPVQCPRPASECQVAVCDSQSGCGAAAAPDFSPCGNFTCEEGAFCIAGSCAQAPTPEGFPCAPPTPCQGEGTCQSQVCVRPDAGELAPSFSFSVPAGPSAEEEGDPVLVAVEGNLFAELCTPDGGCALGSWTFNGFERFLSPHADLRPRRVLGATPTGVWVSAGDALELYAPGTGQLLAGYPLAMDGGTEGLAPGGFAITREGALWVSLQRVTGGVDAGEPDAGEADAGELDAGELDAGELDAGDPDAGDPGPAGALRLVWLPADGGELAAYPLGEDWEPPQLVLDEEDGLYLSVPGQWIRKVIPDGGSLETGWSMPADAGSGVALGQGRLLVGGSLSLPADGGGAVQLAPEGAAGEPIRPLGEWVLLNRSAAFGLYRSCTTPFVDPCAEEEKGLWVRSFLPEDGGVLWRAQVLSPETPGRVAQWVNVDGGVAILTQRAADGGIPQLRLQGFFDGDEYLNCPLEGGGQLGAALFDGPALYLLRERDGGWTFDAYDFTGAPLDYSGWGSRGSLGGTRRAQP